MTYSPYIRPDVRRLKVWLASLCLFVTSASFADSMATGRELIDKMSKASQELTYSGAFVFAHGGELETMRIYHTYAGGVERERLMSLTGEAREIIRDAENVVCIWPGTKSVSVSRSTPKTPFPEFDADQLGQLAKLYSFKRSGMDRVAGRKAEVVDIRPLDNYRYGYRLWIDSETFLMLRSVMSDNRGSVIEQVMYTEIEFPDSIAAELLRASVEGERQEWVVDIDEPHIPETPDTDIPGIGNFTAPEGFSLMSDKVLMLPQDSVVRRIMYTDGLASMSVYIASSADNGKSELQGISGMGAVHAFGVMQGNWHVTVVGEVPKPTVKMVGKSLTLAGR